MPVKIPLVKRESVSERNCRMGITVVFIVMLVLCMFDSATSSRRSHKNIPMPINCRNHKHSLEAMKSDEIRWSTTGKPIAGRYIHLINNNKKLIPINRLVVLADEMIEKTRSVAKIIDHNDTGTTMIFDLKAEHDITQLVLEVNMFCRGRDNIRTTQIEIRDKDYKIVWSSDEPLPLGLRQIPVYIVKPNIVYPVPQVILCDGSSIPDQEKTLISHLQTNIW